jgi:hypothetical protein
MTLHQQPARARRDSLAKPNYRQQKKQREQAKKKKNDEKLLRKGRKPAVDGTVPTT